MAQIKATGPAAPPLAFRCLEPRRVLSVNAVFASGVLDITIVDDGGNVDASLLSDVGGEFFVDADGDQLYNPLELRGLLADLTQVTVMGDAGVGNFFWRDNFSTAALSAPGMNVLDISQVLSAELTATASLDGNVSISAEQSIQFGGSLSIAGDLTATTALPTSSITGIAGGSLDVTGHAALTANTISLGTAGGEHLALGSLTVTSTGVVDISEDGTVDDPGTLLTGANTATSLNIASGGSITLESGASIITDDAVQLIASSAGSDVNVDGSITSTAGDITLHAADQVAVGSAASIATSGVGAIDLTATGAGITLADGSQLSTVDGSLGLTALAPGAGDISLSQLATGASGSVQIVANGNITDGTASETANILSPTGSLFVQSLSGSIGSAADDLNVDVQNLVFDAGTATLGIVHISDLAGGLRINGPSRAAAGATITAHSPLIIAADVNVGASSTFTAGNSAAAGDNLTIENGATVTLNSLVPATLTFNAGDDIVFSGGGRIVTTGINLHSVELNADLDHLGVGAADGDRGSIAQDGTAIVEVATNRLTARAAEGIDLDTQIDSLEAFSSLAGDILIDEVDSLTLTNISTGNGAINVMAAGTVQALNVDSSGTDSDDNDVTIMTTSGDIVATFIRAGLFHGDVTLDAQGNIFDGDMLLDDVDVQGNDVTLVAHTGNIGVEGTSFFKSRPNGLDVITYANPVYPLEPGNLSATALLGSISLNVAVAGSATFATNTLFVTSNGDLDVSTSTFAVSNLALIADADGDGVGTLRLGNSLTVAGNLRLEGADIVSVGPGAPLLNLSATRLLFLSGAQARIVADVDAIDASAFGDLSILATRTAIELVDLNCDNVALQSTNSIGSILLESFGTITVADDILAGNDATTTSTGDIEFRFAVGAMGDILIHDTILSDLGNVLLSAPGSIRLERPAIADLLDEDGADNLAVISTIDGNIALLADSDADGGGIFMADGARIIAGRSSVDYVPGIDGLPSPSTIQLGAAAKGTGLAQIVLSATDAITLGSLQSANNTTSAIQVTSTAGAIVDGGDIDTDIVANQVGAQVTLLAQNGIGSANAIETAAYQIDAQNLGPTGNIAIHEVADGGSLISLALLNSAIGGSALIGVDAGSLEVTGAGAIAVEGDVTLLASNDVHVQSAISTTGAGDIYILAGNTVDDAILPNVDGLTIDADITTQTGSILLQSQQDIRSTAQISSLTGGIGLTASGNITQTNSTITDGDVLVDAGGDLLMEMAASIAGANVLLTAGGSIGLARVSAGRVAIDAGSDVTDRNAGSNNVTAGTLHIKSGGTIGQADPLNGLPDENLNALEIEVNTVAADSAAGIYLHQTADGGSLIVGSVADLMVSITAAQVGFDSSTAPITANQLVSSENGFSATGPIKIRVDTGDLSIASGGGVSTTGASDVLLWAAGDVIVNASVTSGTGHVTLRAGDDVLVNESISTAGAGSLYLLAGNANDGDTALPNVDGISINGELTTVGGSILLSSAQHISLTADVSSSSALVGLVATGNITQSANVTSGGDVLVEAGNAFTMAAGTLIDAAGNVLVQVGDSIGLSTIVGDRVALVAGLDIVNVNGLDTLNVEASGLSMLAGGAIGGSDVGNGAPDQNMYAINVSTSTLAARAVDRIYVQQLASGGDLSIDSVAALNVNVNVSEVRFNSTLSDAVALASTDPLDDLTSDNGPIKLVVRGGSLTVNDGSLGGGLGVVSSGTGDVLLWATGDLATTAAIDGGSGHVTLRAGDDLSIGAAVSTTGTGTLFLSSENSNEGDAVGPAVDGIFVSGALTANESILLVSRGNVNTFGDITSSSQGIGIVATGNILQGSNLSAVSVLVSSGGTYTQIGNILASNVQLVSSGTIQLGQVIADTVSITSVDGDVLDFNGPNVLNVRATTLRLEAGGIIGGPDSLVAQDENGNAIDIEVDTLAAKSRDGIYLQQLSTAGDLTIDVVTVGTGITVEQVRFNSTLTEETAAVAAGTSPLADLQTANGPIKVAVLNGSLTVNDGDADGVGVLAGGSGDVLLRSTAELTTNASISSGTGHVTLQALTVVDLNASIFTAGAGSIYIAGQSIDVDGAIDSVAGGILLRATNDIRTTATISSTGNSLGLIASSGDVQQGASVSAGGALLVEAGGNYTQANASATASAATNVQVTAGDSIRLVSITGTHVSLTAGRDILDNSATETANIKAQTLGLVAGGIIGGADIPNAPDENFNALDIEVGALAARGANGVYLQQLSTAGSLVIDHVQGAALVEVNQVRFNSTLTVANAGDGSPAGMRPLEDVRSDDGPVKIVVRNGSLTVNDGLLGDGIGVMAAGADDILLWASGDLTTNAEVASGGGHITLQAGNDLTTNAAVSTLLSGSILFTGRDIAINSTVSSVDGDMLFNATRDISTSSTLTSTNGSLGLIAVGEILQTADITAGGDVLLQAGGDITQADVLTTAAGNLQVNSATGTLSIGELSGVHVSLSAGQNILDVNGSDVNIRGDTLRLEAGGIIGGPDPGAMADENGQAIDIEVNTLAAKSRDGIYLQQLGAAGDLIVDLVPGATSAAIVSVEQVRFNSSLTTITVDDTLGTPSLADLETTAGPIKVVVLNGSLTINDGDGDGVGVVAGGSGDVLLRSTANLTANTSISSGTGHVTLQGLGVVDLNAPVFTGGIGSIYVTGQSIDVDGAIDAVDGGILLAATDDIRTTTTVSSANNSIGLIATAGDVLQGANITAGIDLLVQAGGDFTQSSGIAHAGGTTQAIAGGTMRLDRISGGHVSLTAGQSILDNNGGDSWNIRANTLAMVAGDIIGGADLANSLDANFNALDIEVGTLAARGTNGVYLQQLSSAGSLVIDHVDGSASVTVNQVRFKSTLTAVNVGDTTPAGLLPLEDVRSTDGPVKIVVRNGSLTVNDGILANGVGVSVAGAHDILLWASGDLTTNAQVASGGGHITLQAGNDLTTNSTVSTLLSGSIYFSGRDITSNSAVSSVGGDMLFSSSRDIVTTATLTSTNGSVGLIAVGEIGQTANITAGRDVLLQAGGDITQADVLTTAGRNLQASSATGTLRIGELSAVHASLTAGLDILDVNGARVNIHSDTLRLEAGGIIGGPDPGATPDQNGQAIDIEAQMLAAKSRDGIYLQQLATAGDLVVDLVPGVSSAAEVSVEQVRFNSTVTPITVVDTLRPQPLADLETTAGPVKVVVLNGSLTINDGDSDGVGVLAGGSGDVLLRSTANLTANASISSGTGHVTLQGLAAVDLNAQVFTGGTGSIYVTGQSIDVDGAIDTVNGGILLSASDDIRTTATIKSDSNGIGLIATTGDVRQGADITAGLDILVQAGRDFIQASGTSQAGQTAQVIAARTILLGEINGNHVSLTAGQDILDNNGENVLNIAASTLAMTAGGIIGGSDLGNADDANRNAIDLRVSTVAARSANGIYLQQLMGVGDLTVDHVAGAATVEIQQVRFNSSRSAVQVGHVTGDPLPELNDLETTAGPIKVVVRNGSLIVNDGQDGDGLGVSASGASDVLLAASADVVANADILSAGGNMELRAGGDIESHEAIETSNSGTIYLSAGVDQRLSGTINTQAGDILFRAGQDLTHSGTIESDSGNVGLMIGRDTIHSGSLKTAGDVLVQTGRNLMMGLGSIDAGMNLLVKSGTPTVVGGQQLGVLTAANISLDATGDILDGNAGLLNISTDNLRVIGNSLGTKADPLEIHTKVLAAQTVAGIYVVQPMAASNDLTIGHVASINVDVNVQQVNFKSNTGSVNVNVQLSKLDDLQTDRPQTGTNTAIEVLVVGGNLIVLEGADADGSGVLVTSTGSIHLQTSMVGSSVLEGNIALQTGVETRGVGLAGVVSLEAYGHIAELARDASGTVSDARVIGDSLVLHAGRYAHLHNVFVNSLTATVGANGTLDGNWQQTNARANDRGDDFLDQLGSDRQASAQSEGVMVDIDRTTSNTRESALRQSYDVVAEQFRFEDTYSREYALFVRNTKSLEVKGVIAGDSVAPSLSPTVYIETVGVGSNLTIAANSSIATYSNMETEGGIVLVAGGRLNMNGSLVTSAEISSALTRIQRIDAIGSLATTDALGRAAVGYLNGSVFNGGEGVAPRDPLLTSTQFVIRDQQFGLSAFSEDYRSHVFQRVVAQYGFAGESGFVTFVGYADGEIQQFDVQGESGARSTTIDNTDPNDPSALPAVLSGSAMATAFSRATAFDPQFLDANQVLPTTFVVRRAADFFLFENAAAENVADIRDMTVESFQVKNVFTLGTQGAIQMPVDPAPVTPPALGPAQLPEIIANPTQLVRNDIELAAIGERTVEVAIYRVFYEDDNANGQAEESELPSENEILSAEVVDERNDEKQSDEMPSGKRLKLGTVKTPSGGSPTAEDIEALKNEFLNDPERPSGAYSIIERGLDDKEVVLDVFSVRDASVGSGESDQPLIRPPTAAELLQQAQPIDPSHADEPEAVSPPINDGASLQGNDHDEVGVSGAAWDLPRAGSRFAHAGLVASSVWLARVQASNSSPSVEKPTRENQAVLEASLVTGAQPTRVDFSRRGRRSRRWQRAKSK